MRKWERLYEYYKGNNAHERITFLKNKIDEKQATPEEKEEYDKMQKVMDYLPKVENIKDAIEGLESNLEILKEEYKNREDNSVIERMEKEARRLEKVIEEKRAEAEKLHKVAENDDYWEKIFEVQNMEDTLVTLKEELNQNQKKESEHPELAGLSKEDLRKVIFKTAGQISRCNVAAELYMRGESLETIKLAIKKDTQYKKFTAKDPLPLTRKEMEQREAEREVHIVEDAEKPEDIEPIDPTESKKVTPEETHRIVQDPTEVLHTQTEPTQLLNIEELRARHGVLSRLTKIPFLGKLAEKRLNALVEREYRELRDKLRGKIASEETGAEHVKSNEPAQEASQPEQEQTRAETSKERRTKFIESLSDYDITDIADKGLDKLEEERKREKLIEAKEKAILRQNDKFGDKYSQKSGDQDSLDRMHEDDGEER